MFTTIGFFLPKGRRYNREDTLKDRTSINKAVEKGENKTYPQKEKSTTYASYLPSPKSRLFDHLPVAL